HGEILERRGILYAPDYVINAGGLMNVYTELEGYNRERAMRLCEGIYTNVMRVFEISERENIPTFRAADRLVEERLGAMNRLSPKFNTYDLRSWFSRS